MDLRTTVTNERDPASIAASAEDGAFVHGFTLQGASWEIGRGGEQGSLGEMIPKELTPELPVMHVTAIERHLQVKNRLLHLPSLHHNIERWYLRVPSPSQNGV